MHAAWASSGARAHIDLDPSSPSLVFAADEIESALNAVGHSLERHDSRELNSYPYRGVITIRLWAGPRPGSDAAAGLAPEGFRIRSSKVGFRRYVDVTGADAAGAMYGGL